MYVEGQIEHIMSSITSQRLLRLAVLYLCPRCSEFLAEEYLATDQSTIQLIKAYPEIKACATIRQRATAIKGGASVVFANQFNDSTQFGISEDLLFLKVLKDKFAAICPRCLESLSDSISLLDDEICRIINSTTLYVTKIELGHDDKNRTRGFIDDLVHEDTEVFSHGV